MSMAEGFGNALHNLRKENNKLKKQVEDKEVMLERYRELCRHKGIPTIESFLGKA